MPRSQEPAIRPIVRDAVAVALLAALALGGYFWYRASAALGQWQTVERGTEGVRFRLPPDWATIPAGYADADFRARRAGAGVVLAVRSWAIPPAIHAGGRGSPEAAAVDTWAEGQRGQALGSRRILDERRIRVSGARGVLQLFESPGDALRYFVVAAAARDGRLYAFSAQVGSGVEPRAAVRLLRRILGTVEWLPLSRLPEVSAASPPGASLP